ncbi:predicted protein [Arabidopsis lyrata subsp. lyrata]|uniref:Predicted protein n=1 Tax=Arabidopsis lyrata subsp. lyrata TaxID=81972 RepID=D7LXZ4_ARALL|nr:predicted protein [Arabidopsis lyrata subsp. lyrata]
MQMLHLCVSARHLSRRGFLDLPRRRTLIKSCRLEKEIPIRAVLSGDGTALAADSKEAGLCGKLKKSRSSFTVEAWIPLSLCHGLRRTTVVKLYVSPPMLVRYITKMPNVDSFS